MRQGVGYIDVPWFVSNEHLSQEGFAGQLQSIIAELDALNPVGWVVDLRRNGGGNMWPMLAGLGPLLGHNPIGFFAAANSFAWRYEDGAALIDRNILCRADGKAHTLRVAEPKTAVLIGQGTASSGEAVCIAFAGRPHTRSFGAPTAGQSTANESHALSDGAILALTASIMADRLGRTYEHVIVPDVIVSPESADQEHDATWVEAIAWIGQADD
jgi:C-terminal processing protease CtpA/Prc